MKPEGFTLTKVTGLKIYFILFWEAHKNTSQDQSFFIGLEEIKSYRKYLQDRKKITISDPFVSFSAEIYYLEKKKKIVASCTINETCFLVI